MKAFAKHLFFPILFLLLSSFAWAQKIRPDAFPPEEQLMPKIVNMASTVSQMASWDRYPTYSTYVEMMQLFASQYPSICRLDTIGTSIEGRLILCVKISDNVAQDEASEPEFFYSSTMHGDEVTGFYLMLRLINYLLTGYGSDPECTDLVNRVQIYINPLSNPDGTYHYGNNTVQGSMRYNANYVDLNRNYPDPFGTEPYNAVQPENLAMIDYVTNHHFRLSANLHGGSEVMNYPWDSYETYEQPHPYASWWAAVGKRFVDTCRKVDHFAFYDVNSAGVIAGGDWYVISNGRQDYMNYYHDCLEITMELSSDKILSTDQLCHYWDMQYRSLINYIKEIYTLPNNVGIDIPSSTSFRCFPNPTSGLLVLEQKDNGAEGVLMDVMGREILRIPAGTTSLDLSDLPTGLYILRLAGRTEKIVKR